MRYEIKKILSCKILMISMIVAFIFSMAISYNAYANEKIDLREFSAYIGDFSERKYDVMLTYSFSYVLLRLIHSLR